MGPHSFSVDAAAGVPWTAAAAFQNEATTGETSAGAAADATSRWLLLFEGAVPHVAAFLDGPEHLGLAAACRSLHHVWPQVAGLTTLAIFLDRNALLPSSSSPAWPQQQQQGIVPSVGLNRTAVASSSSSDENRDPNEQWGATGVVGPPRGSSVAQHHQGQQRRRQPWNPLSRLLRHWAPYVETLRFSGALAGPVEDYLKEALGPALATPITIPAAVPHEPGSKRPLLTPAMPRLKALCMPRVGLLSFHATAVAGFLVGPGGARLEALDLSHNSGLRDDGVLAIFRAVSAAAERAVAAEARAAAASSNVGNSSRRVVRRRRASSEPTHKLPALRRLDLSYTQVTAVGLRALALALSKGAMPNLEELVVSGNPLKDQGGAVLAALIEAGALPRLQLLDATACGLGPSATCTLAVAASSSTGPLPLHSLLIGSNYVDSQGAGALALAIRAGRLPKLAHLRIDLSGEGSAASLFEALASCDGGSGGVLRRLDLGKNASLSGAAWRRALRPVYNHQLTALTTPPVLAGLEKLTLAGCRRLGHHGPAALVQWAEAFGGNKAPALRVLDLGHTGLRGALAEEEAEQGEEPAGPHLARLLGRLPHLEALSLRGNTLYGAGMACLAEEAAALGQRCRVRALDVAEAALGDAGCVALANALLRGAFPALRRLDVSNNGIGPVGWGALVRALGRRAGQAATGLEALDASKNPLRVEGEGGLVCSSAETAHALRALLCNGTGGLRSIKLASTGLDAADGAALVSVLELGMGAVGTTEEEEEDGEHDSDAMEVEDDRRPSCHQPSRLALLDLAYNPQLGPEAARRLLRLAFDAPGALRAPSRPLLRLQVLSLVGTGAGEAAVAEAGALLVQEDRTWLLSRLELVDLRGNEVGREARVLLQGQLLRVRAGLLQGGLCGYSRRLQGLVRVGSS